MFHCPQASGQQVGWTCLSEMRTPCLEPLGGGGGAGTIQEASREDSPWLHPWPGRSGSGTDRRDQAEPWVWLGHCPCGALCGTTAELDKTSVWLRLIQAPNTFHCTGVPPLGPAFSVQNQLLLFVSAPSRPSTPLHTRCLPYRPWASHTSHTYVHTQRMPRTACNTKRMLTDRHTANNKTIVHTQDIFPTFLL